MLRGYRKSTSGCWSSCADLDSFQALAGVAEVVELDPHAIHDREIQAAHLALVVAVVQIAQGAARFQRSAQAARKNQREPAVVVLAARPHVREEHQAGVVENRAFAFLHTVELRRKVSELTQMEV